VAPPHFWNAAPHLTFWPVPEKEERSARGETEGRWGGGPFISAGGYTSEHRSRRKSRRLDKRVVRTDGPVCMCVQEYGCKNCRDGVQKSVHAAFPRETTHDWIDF
jgi:hypothetical protein